MQGVVAVSVLVRCIDFTACWRRYKGNLHKAVFGALHATGVFKLIPVSRSLTEFTFYILTLTWFDHRAVVARMSQDSPTIWAIQEDELVNYKCSLFRRQNQVCTLSTRGASFPIFVDAKMPVLGLSGVSGAIEEEEKE